MNDTIREPAWVTAAADQRIATFSEILGGVEAVRDMTVIMMALTDPKDESDAAFQRWDKSCDRCGVYLPNDLITKQVFRKLHETTAVISVGACTECWRLP